MFAHAANFSATNCFEIRRAVSASGNVLSASRVIPSEVEEPRAITLGYHRWILRLHFAPLRMTCPADPAATKHNIIVVNYCSLSGRHGTLWLMQTNASAIVFRSN